MRLDDGWQSCLVLLANFANSQPISNGDQTLIANKNPKPGVRSAPTNDLLCRNITPPQTHQRARGKFLSRGRFMTLIRSFVSPPRLLLANLRSSKPHLFPLASQCLQEPYPARLGHSGSIRFNSQPRKPAAKMSDLTHPTIKGEIFDVIYTCRVVWFRLAFQAAPTIPIFQFKCVP